MLSAGRDMAAPSAALRQRRAAPGGGGGPEAPGRAAAGAAAGAAGGGAVPPVSPGTFWLTRIVLLRAVALLYRECPGAVLLAVAPGREEKQKKGGAGSEMGAAGLAHGALGPPGCVCGRRSSWCRGRRPGSAQSCLGLGWWGLGCLGGQKGGVGRAPCSKKQGQS